MGAHEEPKGRHRGLKWTCRSCLAHLASKMNPKLSQKGAKINQNGHLLLPFGLQNEPRIELKGCQNLLLHFCIKKHVGISFDNKKGQKLPNGTPKPPLDAPGALQETPDDPKGTNENVKIFCDRGSVSRRPPDDPKGTNENVKNIL